MTMLVLPSCRAASGIEVSNAWTRPTMIGDNGAVYFTGAHILVTLHFQEHSDIVLSIPVQEMASGDAKEDH
jgi:copper(I)-binding protein